MDKKIIQKVIISIIILILAIPLAMILALAYSYIFMCNLKSPSGFNCTLANIVSIGGAIVIVITLILNLFRKKSKK